MGNLFRLVDDLIELAIEMDFQEWLLEIVQSLRSGIDYFSWVGLYWVVGDRLVLGTWDGPAATEHFTIPIDKGVYSTDAGMRETVIIDDVLEHPQQHLACFPNTRSEIVVPIKKHSKVIGEINIGSDKPRAFDKSDQRALQRLALEIADWETL